jgi:hypothetical protein
MKSSGKLNFIKSNTLAIAIQKYYDLLLAVIKQEKLFIIAVQKYSERGNTKLEYKFFYSAFTSKKMKWKFFTTKHVTFKKP